MSFALPKNVPSFNNPQRGIENEYWASSGLSSRTANGQHASSTNGGMSGKLDAFFDKRQLPMYKDKPYKYAASGRIRRWYQRRRVLVGVILGLLALAYWFGAFSSSSSGGHQDVKSQGAMSAWDWPPPIMHTVPTIDWNDRREQVKAAFVLSWEGYEKYAWGHDVYHPVSKKGDQITPKGLGWIIVDAIDTLMIMNLTSQLSHARDWIVTSLDYDQDEAVNTFETTIRMLGGLLSAHYISTTFPEMAPVEDNLGEDLYIEKAADLADRLLGAFDSKSGVPFSSVNLKDSKGVPNHFDGGASSTAEAGSLQLEFKYLALLTGEKNYWDKVEKVMQVIDDNGMQDGLLPIYIFPDSGNFKGNLIRLGSRGDSYYEYLIKQYLQTSGQEPIYLEMWDQALTGVLKHLVTYTKNFQLTLIGERLQGLKGDLSPKMDHLVCFMPGTIALATTMGATLDEARRSADWDTKDEDNMILAAELIKTCYGMYKATATGLAPEISYFKTNDPPHMFYEGPLRSDDGILNPFAYSSEEDTTWKSDYVIHQQDLHNLQRPETVESLFYMYRITLNPVYRQIGWEIFSSFLTHTLIPFSDAGFSSLSNANEIPPKFRDNMESFWLAETLKYLYLLFSDDENLFPLQDVVFNTEAHIFPRQGLSKGMKTGWERKVRDEAGRIVRERDGGGDLIPEEADGKEIVTKTRVDRKTIQVIATKVAESVVTEED